MDQPFDIHQLERDQLEGFACDEWWNELIERFDASLEAQDLDENGADLGLLSGVLEHAWALERVGPASITPEIQERALVDYASTHEFIDSEVASAFIFVLNAFWTFAERRLGLENAIACRDALTPELEDRLYDIVLKQFESDEEGEDDSDELLPIDPAEVPDLMERAFVIAFPELYKTLSPQQLALVRKGGVKELTPTLSPAQRALALGPDHEPDPDPPFTIDPNREARQRAQKEKNRKKEKAARKARKKNRR